MKKFFIIFLILIIVTGYALRNNITDIYANLFVNKISDMELKLSSLQNENQYLKSVTESSSTYKSFLDNGVIDPIVANATFLDSVKLLYSDIILNKGESSGVSVNKLVYVSGVRPVGIIKVVNKDSSKLELFSSYKNNLESFVLNGSGDNSSSTNIDLVGDGSFGFYAKVLDSFDIKEGENVYLKNYPSLVVATVKKVEDIESENEKNVYFKSNFDNNTPRVFFIER